MGMRKRGGGCVCVNVCADTHRAERARVAEHEAANKEKVSPVGALKLKLERTLYK